MELIRAKQITVSKDMINVTYKGMSIYIENIDSEHGTARIHPLDEPDKRQEVPLTDLIEQ